MKITVEPRDQYTILHLRGEFDTFYCSLLIDEVNELIDAGVTHVVLNMRLVRFINSTALSAVLRSANRLRELDGRLTISRPSPFARSVMQKVGIERRVPFFDSDEAAGEGAAADESTSGELPPDDEDNATILFTLVDQDRIEHFVPMEVRTGKTTNPVHGHAFGGSWRGLGNMLSVDSNGLRFTWNGGRTQLSPFEMAQMLAIGTDLKVKFRLHMYQPGHYSAVVTVEEIDERPDSVRVGAGFSEIDGDTRTAVQQYTEDLAFLKKELGKES
jgi:anti-sigma B factor antagonist